MSDDIKIGIVSDTREFEQGVKSGVIKPLESVEAAAKNVGKAGDKAGDDIEDGMRDAQTATKKFDRDFKDLAREVKEQSRSAGRSVGDNISDGTRKAGEGVQTLKDEVRSNAQEISASFDGSVEGLAGGLQGLVAVATSGFGIIGLAAGALAAGGIGAITTALQGSQEEADKTAERVNSMYNDMIESGKRYVSAEFVQQQIGEIANDAERIAKLREIAKNTGIDIAVLVAAEAGDTEARARTIGTINDQLAANLKLQQEGTFETNEQLTDVENMAIKIGDAADYFGKLSTEQGQAAKDADLFARASDVAAGSIAAQREEVQKRNKLLAETPTDQTVKLRLDTSTAERDVTDFLRTPRTLKLNVAPQYGRIVQ